MAILDRERRLALRPAPQGGPGRVGSRGAVRMTTHRSGTASTGPTKRIVQLHDDGERYRAHQCLAGRPAPV